MRTSQMKSFKETASAVIAVLMLFGLATGTAIGVVSLVLKIRPCTWSSDPFGGGCGDHSMSSFLVEILLGILLGSVLFIGFFALYLRRCGPFQEQAQLLNSAPPLLFWWKITFVLTLVGWLAILWPGTALIVSELEWGLTLVHAIFAYLIAKDLPRKQAVALTTVAVVFMPLGAIGVFCYLYWLHKKQTASRNAPA